MKIVTTAQHIDQDTAAAMASRRQLGLLDWIVLLFNPAARKPQRILDARLVYYPFWFIGAELSFSRPGTQPRIEYQFVVVDGFFLNANRVIGAPDAEPREVEASRVVLSRGGREQATTAALEYLNKTSSLRYKKVPEMKALEVRHLYKPYFLVECDRGGKRYHLAYDAESGMRNYYLDVKARELRFEDAPAAESQSQSTNQEQQP